MQLGLARVVHARRVALEALEQPPVDQVLGDVRHLVRVRARVRVRVRVRVGVGVEVAVTVG